MDREIMEIYESDSDMIHQAAERAGTTVDGKPLPKEVDVDDRVWVICSCGKRFLQSDERASR